MSILKLKRSAVASKVPLTTDLELGELAINTYDGKLFIKKNNGTESIVEIGAGGGGGSTNLTYSANGSAVTVLSDTGTDAVILAANSTVAGVITVETQVFTGTKTFQGGGVRANGSPIIALSTLGDVNLGAFDEFGGITTSGDGVGFTSYGATAGRAAVVIQGDALTFLTGNSSINTAESMRISVTGNVGIGNTSPTHKLSVAGTVSITGNTSIGAALIANNTPGTAGQVLTSNATGTYWSTISGGGSVTLDSLTDVIIGNTTALATGDVLWYNGTEWENNAEIAFYLAAHITNLAPLSRQSNATAIVAMSVGTTAPSSPAVGDLWVDTN